MRQQTKLTGPDNGQTENGRIGRASDLAGKAPRRLQAPRTAVGRGKLAETVCSPLLGGLAGKLGHTGPYRRVTAIVVSRWDWTYAQYVAVALLWTGRSTCYRATIQADKAEAPIVTLPFIAEITCKYSDLRRHTQFVPVPNFTEVAL